ncbi:hypothetical protein ABT126_40970 [Streptomyces sp. NPDC002012]|uniref:hypothetical protein n=1 Tax=unclassified Streptomyces TaxID=2593676 RepID=UPI0033172BD2
MQDIHPAVRRIARLCVNLEADSTLRAELIDAGLSESTWARIVEAVRQGEADSLIPVLEELEAAAESAGLDGVTVTSRVYQPLPGNGDPPVRTVSGWRCPHARPCGRADVGADPRTERRCALSGDPLAWASVTSG